MLDATQFVVSVATVAIGEAVAAQAPSRPAPSSEPPPPRGWVAICAALVVAAVASRWWSIHHIFGVGNEFVAVARACHLKSHGGRESDLAALLHAPLHEYLIAAWIDALDALGAPPQARWIRLPNVALTGLLVFTLARLGRALRAPWAGLGASALYIASPLLMQLHTNQENYLLEALGAALFAERLATCLVVGVPAYRSLAGAACLAFAAGYMNAPLLGMGAVVALGVMLRRRDLHGLTLSLGWTLALTGPLFARLFEATQALRSVSHDPRSQPNLMHESMPMTTAFGSGQASVLLQRLLDAIGGPAGAWLVAAAACVAVLRPAAWVGVAVCAGTFVAGLVLPFKLQNYAPAALTLLFLACWGVEEVSRRVAELARHRLARAESAALLAPAALSIYVVLTGSAAFRRWPLGRENSYFLSCRDVAPLRRALIASPRTPLMIVAQRIPDPEFVELCRDVRSTREFVACVEQVRAPRSDQAWTTAAVAGRPIAAPTENLSSPSVPRPLREGASALTASPPWSQGFLLWTGKDQSRSSPFVGELLADLEARCPVTVTLETNTLRRCPPR